MERKFQPITRFAGAPASSGLLRLSQKKNVPIRNCGSGREKVIPSGFEPETHSLEGCCSIQLSYGTRTLYAEMRSQR